MDVNFISNRIEKHKRGKATNAELHYRILMTMEKTYSGESIPRKEYRKIWKLVTLMEWQRNKINAR